MERRNGLSLVELTVYLAVSLSLVALVFALATSYTRRAQRWQSDVAGLCQTAGAIQLLRHDLAHAPTQVKKYSELDETHLGFDLDGMHIRWYFDEAKHCLKRSLRRHGHEADEVTVLSGVEVVSWDIHRFGPFVRAVSITFLCAGKRISHTIALHHEQIFIS